jgi:hypothetical protein
MNLEAAAVAFVLGFALMFAAWPGLKALGVF